MVYPHSFRQKNSETITTSSAYGEYYARNISTKIKIQPELKKILQWVDSYRPAQIQDLADMVAIPSVSGDENHLDDLDRMIKMTEGWLTKLGVKYECFNVGYYELNGKKLKIPPVILGQLGVDKNKYTVVVYGHLDVSDPSEQKGWDTDPFKLERKDKTLYGAGVAVSKAPLLMWFHAIQAYKEANVQIPVNLRFVIESMHEQQNIGLETFLQTQVIGSLRDVNYLIVCDSNWLGKNIPCLTYGCTGYAHIWMTSEKVEGSTKDPRDDLENIAKAMQADGKVLIDNIYKNVEQITPDEEILYENIRDFDVREYQSVLPDYQKNWDKMKLLMHFWRLPAIQANEIEECTCDKKNTTPLKLKRTFIMKLVPNQIPEFVDMVMGEFLIRVIPELGITNKIDCKMMYGNRPWVGDVTGVHYEAAKRATIQIYKEVPSMIREDREIPVLLILSNVFKKDVLLLPLGNSQVNFRQANENISERCYFEGTKLLAACLMQLSYIERQRGD